MLFVVATPIGNLGDFGQRAREILAGVEVIAAEDTRRTAKLLAFYGIDTPLVSYHAYNEAVMTEKLIERMNAGERLALVSDAGTPLVSDPGFSLVDRCLRQGINVVPVPGPNAAVGALSVAGIAGQGFTFEGFLPSRPAPRRSRLEALKDYPHPLVFYEAPHRIAVSLAAMAAVLGGHRNATVCRELTKKFEQLVRAPLSVLEKLIGDEIPARGEFVIVVEGSGGKRNPDMFDTGKLVKELLKELPPSKVARVVARVTGDNRKQVYELAMRLSRDS